MDEFLSRLFIKFNRAASSSAEVDTVVSLSRRRYPDGDDVTSND
jgi:hypothetical protein